MRGWKALIALLTAQTLMFAAGRKVVGSDVVELVFTSMYSDRDDAHLAKELERLRMNERLDRHIVTYFQRSGLGPRALEALSRLSDDSASLPLPPEEPFSIQPLPSDDRRRDMLQSLAEYGRNYVRNLPNFVCVQVTKRFSNFAGTPGQAQFGETLHYGDTLSAKLSFSGGVEQSAYGSEPVRKLRLVDTKAGQSISMGEFGGDMAMIFGAGINPELRWDHWEVFRGKRRAVFSYYVGLPASRFTLFFCCTTQIGAGRPGGEERQQSYTSAIRGLVMLDPDSGAIARLIVTAVDMPQSFHIKESRTIINYGAVNIAGREYTLPVQAQVYVRSDQQRNLNEIAFNQYRKFDPASVMTSVDSKITYQSDGKQ